MATQVLRVICVSAAEPRTDTGSGAVLPDRVLMPVESVTSVHRHTHNTLGTCLKHQIQLKTSQTKAMELMGGRTAPVTSDRIQLGPAVF